SIAVHMAFAFSMRVAPVQIWWAMKYHSLEFPEIDGYLTNQSAGSTKLVEGRLWRSAPLASEEWHRPQLAAEAAQVRAEFSQYRLLFGCIGREEKINSAAFLEGVAAILKACPDAGFVWTGRERSASVQAALARSGVAERCHFIGWVDTKLYAQVLDVFLDSFPFPCGFTLYEAMAAAKPIVTYASAEAAETGIYGLLAPLLSGATGSTDEIAAARKLFADGDLFHCAHDPAEYVQLALRLAGDEGARRAAGEANQAFVREFLSDRRGMAEAVATHFLELIRARIGANPR
ncbi:MAG TPA: glycosyltransferase, partial [Burkholderiales bacterium]|nr:glycosyltransferase [Burkholderiales bacterium]